MVKIAANQTAEAAVGTATILNTGVTEAMAERLLVIYFHGKGKLSRPWADLYSSETQVLPLCVPKP